MNVLSILLCNLKVKKLKRKAKNKNYFHVFTIMDPESEADLSFLRL
jgi:hypothetical protein